MDEKDWQKHIAGLRKQKIKTNKALLKKALVDSVSRLAQKKRSGILFSGGVDSSTIALICRQLKKDFICYSVGFRDWNTKHPEDLEWAEKAAERLNLKLKTKIYDLKEAEKLIKKMVKLVGPEVVNVGVGCVTYAASLLAKKDRIDFLFSGLGSEEIFAGYERHALAKDKNKECWKGLNQMWQRDIVRDNKISKTLKVKFLTPFLDDKLIVHAMNIPASRKINKTQKKIILRETAEELGLAKEFAWRQKRAAQYGSGFDKAIAKLAKKNGFRYKKDYLESLV